MPRPAAPVLSGGDALALAYARLAEVAETARASTLANSVNFLVTAAYLWFAGYVGAVPLLLAGAMLAVLSAERLRMQRRMDHLKMDDAAGIAKVERRTQLVATLLGSCWGGFAAVMLALQNPSVAIPAIALGAGMLSAGAITFRALPRAALGYVLGCSVFCGIGLLAYGTSASFITEGLLAAYTAVLVQSVRVNGRRFTSSFLRRRELARSNETVQLLLNDVTEQGSEWLIEVDRLGRLMNACPRMCESTGRSAAELEGVPFGRLLDGTRAREELKAMFRKGQTIRRHIVSLHVGGQQRWWAVSARPTDDPRILYRGVVSDITAERQAEQKVQYMAHFDGLTDLPNRFQFNERLDRLLHRGARAAGVMYIDLDHFKAVNDTLGHSTGDRLLQEVARRLEHVVGRRGLVARLGGDEFAVLLTPRGLRVMDALARRIVQDLRQPLRVAEHELAVGASIGMALAPQDADDADGLLRRADLALYAAKAQGRGVALRFDAQMDAAAQARRQLEMDLRRAVEGGQLRLHYQPQIDTRTGATVHCEALVRWQHPVQGLILPDAFIGIAEETGLIVQIGEWAIRQAIEDAARWHASVGVSINLSPLQMRSPTLVPTIVRALGASGLPASRLCLEITETVLIEDNESNAQTLHRLRTLGVQVALDDFGIGYSSLNYLRAFPFDRLKIDRSFVRDMIEREDCRAIIASVISLSRSLGMQVVAEGVEQVAQQQLLAELDCYLMQGHLFSRAVPAEELTQLEWAAENNDARQPRRLRVVS